MNFITFLRVITGSMNFQIMALMSRHGCFFVARSADQTHFFMSTYDLSAGYQLQIGHRVGINVSGLLANVFGRVGKDEAIRTYIFFWWIHI